MTPPCNRPFLGYGGGIDAGSTTIPRGIRRIAQGRTEIAMRIERHQKGKGDFQTTLESSLASRAAELFERSNPEQKRQLLVFVFSNLRLRWKKLEFPLRSPFDLMVNRASYSSWLALKASSSSNCSRAFPWPRSSHCIESAPADAAPMLR
jgi:hypothetical protein